MHDCWFDFQHDSLNIQYIRYAKSSEVIETETPYIK